MGKSWPPSYSHCCGVKLSVSGAHLTLSAQEGPLHHSSPVWPSAPGLGWKGTESLSQHHLPPLPWKEQLWFSARLNRHPCCGGDTLWSNKGHTSPSSAPYASLGFQASLGSRLRCPVGRICPSPTGWKREHLSPRALKGLAGPFLFLPTFREWAPAAWLSFLISRKPWVTHSPSGCA